MIHNNRNVADPATTGQNWLSSPVRTSMNVTAPEYMNRRWLKSRPARSDYAVTRHALLEELNPCPGERILEIGCGPGTWTREVAARGATVVAVDISEQMIQEARQYTAGLPVTYVHSDFMAAELQAPFDKVYSVRAIEYISDRDGLVRKVSGLLRPGGKVVIVTKTRHSIWRGRTKIKYQLLPRAIPSWYRTGMHSDDTVHEVMVRQYLPSPGELARQFRPYGLSSVNMRPLIIRPPIFQDGFHEFPVIPEKLSAPFLAASELAYRISCSLPRPLRLLPLCLSESFCLTVRRDDG